LDSRSFVIIGGGPAGLTAAYELTKLGHRPLVLEKGGLLGGLARTETYKGFHFDMGGHRFFTKAAEVDTLWREVLADDFLRRPRLSRIYYNEKFFYYPLKALDALAGLGLLEAILIILSYVRWKVVPHRQEETFEQWVTNPCRRPSSGASEKHHRPRTRHRSRGRVRVDATVRDLRRSRSRRRCRVASLLRPLSPVLAERLCTALREVEEQLPSLPP